MGVVEKQILFVLEMMVERAVSHLGFLADVSNSEIFKIILGEHLIDGGKDFVFRLFRLDLMREFLAYQRFTLSGTARKKNCYLCYLEFLNLSNIF